MFIATDSTGAFSRFSCVFGFAWLRELRRKNRELEATIVILGDGDAGDAVGAEHHDRRRALIHLVQYAANITKEAGGRADWGYVAAKTPM